MVFEEVAVAVKRVGVANVPEPEGALTCTATSLPVWQSVANVGTAAKRVRESSRMIVRAYFILHTPMFRLNEAAIMSITNVLPSASHTNYVVINETYAR